MSDFDTLRVRMGRKPVVVVELDLDSCANTYGVLPCTASGTSKCYNTFKTCQDRGNFVKQVKTYRLTTENAFLPVGEQIYPCIRDVSIAPTKLETKGISLRANVTITCFDFPYHDRGLDPYWRERPDYAGTFWGKLKARNPYVVNRVVRVKTGYVDDDHVVYTQTRTYFLENIDGPDSNGRVVIKAKDLLKLGDEETSRCPVASNGKLTSDIAADAAILALTPDGIWNEYPDSGYVRIGDEVIGYSSRSVNGLAGLERGALDTIAVAHRANDKVQACLFFENRRAVDILYELLRDFADVPDEYIPYADWIDEDDTWLSLSRFTALLTEPKGVNKLIEELLESSGSVVWWDEIAREIRFRVIRVPLPDNLPVELSDFDNVLKGSTRIRELESERITRVEVYTNLLRASDDVKKENFGTLNLSIDSDAESVNAYGEEKARTILSRWIQSEPIARDTAIMLLARFDVAPKEVTFRLDAKDATLRTGDYADITARLTPNDDGTDGGVRVLVMQREEAVVGSHYEYVGMETGRVGDVACVFAPDDAGDYSAASEEEKRTYMYWCDDDGELDGEPSDRLLC